MASSRRTFHWRPGENSLARESFNDIVNHRKTNVPAVMMRVTTMSRLAMLGRQGLEPIGFASSGKKGGLEEMFRRSVQFDKPVEEGTGSIRLGTPVVEEKPRPRFGPSPLLDTGALQRSTSFPIIRPTPAARFGYMPPGAGRLSRSSSTSGSVVEQATDGLSTSLLAKIVKLYKAMDSNGDGSVSRSEAQNHFKRFAEVSAKAMFNEVDEDNNDEITLEEFVAFWEQVKRSGYKEEDLEYELEELLKGNVWVDYADNREVGGVGVSMSIAN